MTEPSLEAQAEAAAADPTAASIPAGRPVARWEDLRKRVVSAVVLVAVGGAEIWLGGLSFALLVVLLTGAMVWELAKMTAPDHENTPLGLAALACASLAGAIFIEDSVATALLLVPALAIALTDRRDRRLSSLYSVAILVAGYGLVDLRMTAGTPVILWLVLIVVASDVLGYFVGRVLGGPKFWAAISPKKTWSGTVAGWVGAALVGLGFWLAGYGSPGLVALSVLIAFAGQMGDIWESWIKRRCGVKDASTLIPGHGGVLDRFDALIGALVALMLMGLVVALPLPAAG
ncbi:MAG: phosphatidate cytidylyltransferase [Tabrizicola sp.]|jgi:phosphatidate cytidylyltransferase|nr:phosphatidate cytidylyltransferase [Tabrizicola sp.]